MKAVIIGAGEVGYHIAKSLYATNDVIVIEQDEEACKRADELDVQVIQGNGANASILSQVIKGTDILMAVTGSDEVNIVACMASKLIIGDKNKLKTMARVSNPDYIDKPIAKRTSIGIDVMICPELTMASEVAQILAIPSAIDIESFAEGKVEMMELVVSKESYFANKMMKDLHLADCCIVSAIFRKDDVIIPHGGDSIQENDHIVVIGQPSAMKDIRGLLGEVVGRRSKVMIIGGGIVGFYLAKLIGKSEADIKIIESRKDRCEEIADELSGVLVLNGDGTDINLLKDEGINEMDVVVSVTDSDEKNLLCSLIAKKLGVKKVIARSDRSDYISLFEMVGVDSAVSPREATVNEVLKLTMGKGIEAITTIEGQKAEIIEYTASSKSKIVGKPLRDVKFPAGAIVSMIVHKGRTIVPRGSHVIEENDRVVVFALPTALEAVEKLFK
ncbi:K+ transport system, NAD-binding component [Methanomethylovorans hollandica DSM 15978]|uniref:K+ transport system, NAD-binding component n=1 Tax=Methanomethylovorans hollandica (strain DSM 15978 / NBRC 107637 / DMS1) TaxID=867904 RepID=L0KVM5_METHD|nr:Trk system potassium transporter TrkA [Methanomethylovorans hollandica]AGB49186.1 K+ transport system, NAD-binding component [Methanomethylovorans hollandica DSM 15978]